MLNTKLFIERIVYGSLYDKRYRLIPEQDKAIFYQDIVDRYNTTIEEIGIDLGSDIYKNYSSVGNTNGYAVINTQTEEDAGFCDVSNITYNTGRTNYSLTRLDLGELQNRITIIGLQGSPQYWAWYMPKRQLWIYPSPTDSSGSFGVLGRPYFPDIAMSIVENIESKKIEYIFTPEYLDFPNERNFINYLQYKIIQDICIDYNTPFSAEKIMRLEKLEKSLMKNRKMSIRHKPASCELTSSSNIGSYPYFYYLSGGK